MNKFARQWSGSTEENVKSGEGVYVVGDDEYRVRLKSFSQFSDIGAMLNAAYRQGREDAVVDMSRKLHTVLGE